MSGSCGHYRRVEEKVEEGRYLLTMLNLEWFASQGEFSTIRLC